MSASVPRKARVVWTYDDYRLMPDDGLRYEVIDGQMHVTPAPSTTHQKASKRIQTELILQLERKGLAVVYDAPVDLIFGQTRTVQPDIVVVRAENERFITERGIECAPDLVVEILSPSTERTDREVKAKLYASEGVAEYWLVDAITQRVEVLTLGETGFEAQASYGRSDILCAIGFPFAMPVDDIFN